MGCCKGVRLQSQPWGVAECSRFGMTLRPKVAVGGLSNCKVVWGLGSWGTLHVVGV